jgi:16S rRNA (cytosine967-C5)-methyltransferase
VNLRAVAAGLITGVIQHGESLAFTLPAAAEQLPDRDRALLQEICYGSLRWYDFLGGLVDQLIRRPLKPRDWDIYALCVVGAYQLHFTRVPDHAAIKETVDACRSLKKHWATKFVNGVLRQYQRLNQDLIENLTPSQRSAHPEWLYDRINSDWPLAAENILNANNDKPPMVLRVNRQHHSRDEYLALLKESGNDGVACQFSQDGIRLTSPCDVQVLPGFDTGWVSVQDEAPQLCVDLLDVQPGDRVLDACAAPGGKTCHIIERCPEVSQVIALDLDSGRSEKVRDNLSRLQLKADIVVGDACKPEQWWDNTPFDRILIDAPCTASGVIRRHPESKQKRHEEDIDTIAELQEVMLKALWACLRPGGTLVYATCSIFKRENEQVIEAFLADHPEAIHHAIELDCGDSRPFGVQLLPIKNGHDGFYYAKLTKKAN